MSDTLEPFTILGLAFTKTRTVAADVRSSQGAAGALQLPNVS